MASKAPHVLLEAHRGLPPGLATVDLFGAQADYHGDASYRHVLEPFLSCPDVRMRGPQPHARVAEALAALDVLVVPSVWPETSPLVIREAFLAGVPVVASRIGGIPELIVDGENGLLFAPGDVEDLRRTLLRLLEEADLLATLKAGAATTSVRTLADDVHTVRRRYAAGAARRVRAASHRRLAAVVLNFRTAADTALAVASLMASDRPPDELIVVDNDQDGACRSAITRWGSAVTYLPTVRNLGFSGGMNVGIQRALANGADHVLLVNSDVVVSPHCIAHLERALTAEGVGIVGPLVLSRASPDRVGSAGIDYSLRSGRMRHRSAHVPAGGREWADDDVDAVSGCLVLIGRAVFERIGLLDERYFFGFEDIEFCLRARRSGFHTRLVGRAAAYHEGGQAIGAESPRRLYYAARNHLLLARDTGDGDGRAAQVFRMATVSLLNMAHAAKAPGGSLPARLGATLQGIRDYAGRRFGPDAAN